jgi:hypothetical protein
MKTFKEYLIESENDPRADINIPYKTPEDIRQIMTNRGWESDEPGPPPKKKKTRQDLANIQNEKNRKASKERRESGIITGQVNTTGEMSMRDIAKQLGVHPSLVGQIENSAFKKLLAGIQNMQNDPSMLQAWYDVNVSRNRGNRKRDKD